MLSIAQRKKRKQESAILQQARLELLAELDQLKYQLCDKCARPVSSMQFTCDCPAAIRTREIGQELSTLLNDRTEIKTAPKEVRKVTPKNKTPKITEEAVSSMRDKGMTYKAIAKEFGVSMQTLTNRRQNWELERVRKQHQEGKNGKPPTMKGNVTAAEKAKSSTDDSLSNADETEIQELKEKIIRKRNIILDQERTIARLKDERDELAKLNKVADNCQNEILDERKLLAILLNREAARMKKMVEVG